MRCTISLAATALALAACTPAATPPPDTTAAARAAIDAANATWPRLTSTGHADSIADLYAADATIMPPNMATVHGRDSIRAFFAALNTMKGITLTLRAVSVWGSGDAATELGRWTWSWATGTTPPPGVPAADSGKYLVRWVQQNGKWMLAQDIWNSDLPPMTMAATPAAPAKKSR
jgi:ketosteroid isomerase-like protein